MKEVIVSLILVLVCIVSGCYVGVNPVGDEGHIVKIQNQTFGAKNITIQIRGDLIYNGKKYNFFSEKLGYMDKTEVDLRVNQWYKFTYIVPEYYSGQYKYQLVYEEEICLYPENELVEISTPESIHDYEWIPLN